MLTRVLLKYTDDELHRRFLQSRQDFYRKALPLITVLVFALAIALEVINRGLHKGTEALAAATSAVNWLSFIIFLALSFLIRRWAWPAKAVCPLLTIIVYYYFAFVDYQNSPAVLYFT